MQTFKNLFEKRKVSLFLVLTLLATIIPFGMAITFPVHAEIDTGNVKSDFGTLFDHTNQFIVVKHKQLGGSHYAYTDGLSDESGSPEGNEVNFDAGSQMVLVTLEETTTTTTTGGNCNGTGGTTTEKTSVKSNETALLTSSTGVIRDPDVSEDGTRVLFSWKQNSTDDYHLYEMNIATKEYTQLTFGSGIADVEPKYLPNGKIVFQSTRCISSVDCWKIAVMNTYICDRDGSNIIRVGYDQVHTTYPTVTEDGRILYTRWDYNDRNQMYVQGVFQMFPDGTNQTELYGNNSNFPTTLLHTREIPGKTGVYVSISSGHHTKQVGRIVLVDTNKGRNDADAISYPFEKGSTASSEDAQNQGAPLYKYPVALNDHEFLVAYTNSTNHNSFGIYYMNSQTGAKICISESHNSYGGASQVAMIKNRTMFERPSMVNQAVDYGTYYMGNVYEGGGLEGVPVGTAKYLRVVEIEYRPYAIGATIGRGTGSSDPYTPVSVGNGAWDIKRVLGIVDIEADGSALFQVPSDTPVYFQVLNENGELIQSMRSWSTLMANETFSCVGCHEEKNFVPPHQATTTIAMSKGVQKLKPDLWMDVEEEEYDIEEDTDGFSYTEQVQPILDANCISCHKDQTASLSMIGGGNTSGGNSNEPNYTIDNSGIPLLERGSSFKYTTTSQSGNSWTTNNLSNLGSWSTGNAPFGTDTIQGHAPATRLDQFYNTSGKLYLRQDFNLDASYYNNLGAYDVYLRISYDENPVVYLNGTQIFSASGYTTSYQDVKVTDAFVAAAVSGNNELAVFDENTGGGMFIDFGIYLVPKSIAATLIEKGSSFKYTTTKQNNTNWIGTSYNDNSWSTGNAPFGTDTIEGNAPKTNWNKENLYLRSTFNLTQEQYDKVQAGEYAVYMSISYDEDPKIYLNGTQILSRTGYTTAYQTVKVPMAASALKVGQNTIAANVINTTGGQFIDFSLYLKVVPATEGGSSAFSLEGIDVVGEREKMYYSLSYLVLTNASLNGNQYLANSTNNYTNWISSMSQCEMLTPYQFGSTQSNVIAMLKTGHGGTNLTEKEIDTIAAWIDLGVPFRGEYNERTNWGTNEQREAIIKQNKRDYYDALDKTQKRILSGTEYTDTLPITISYSGNSTSVTDNGMAILYPGTSYASGKKVTVTLPEGVQYFFFGLDARLGEALIYCPSGTYTYTIPSDTGNYFPVTFTSAKNPTISARIATDDELAESRNLAKNPYAISTNTEYVSYYPHAKVSSQYNTSEFAARNALDGFNINEGHGTYPLQSWGAKESEATSYYNVLFGKEVLVDSVGIEVRADWSGGHDTYYTSAVLEFSDGTTQSIKLEKVAGKQVFAINGGAKKTSYVKIRDMQSAGGQWAGLSEVEVYGSAYEEDYNPLLGISIPENAALMVGLKKNLAVTYMPNDTTSDKTVTWSSTDSSVVSVDSNGTIFAKKAGTATITAKVGEFTDTCTVTVAKDLEGVTVYDYMSGDAVTVYYPENTIALESEGKDTNYLYPSWYDKQESAGDESVITSATVGSDIYQHRIPIDVPVSDGRTIRVANDGTNGLRFKASINREAFYQYFNGDNDYVYDEAHAFTFGMLIIPTRVLGDNELTLETTSAKNIVGKKVYAQRNSEGDLEFTGVLTGIPKSAYTWDIAARAYITFQYGGETHTIYSEETLVGSYQEVAKLVYNDPDIAQSIKDKLEEIFGDALKN